MIFEFQESKMFIENFNSNVMQVKWKTNFKHFSVQIAEPTRNSTSIFLSHIFSLCVFFHSKLCFQNNSFSFFWVFMWHKQRTREPSCDRMKSIISKASKIAAFSKWCQCTNKNDVYCGRPVNMVFLVPSAYRTCHFRMNINFHLKARPTPQFIYFVSTYFITFWSYLNP